MHRQKQLGILAVMSANSRRKAPALLFPLLAVVQVCSALAFLAYLFDDSPATSHAQVDFELTVLPFSPLVWLGLALLGAAALIAWRTGVWRTIAIVSTSVSAAFGLLGAGLAVLMLTALSSHGAHFSYPDAPPLPDFAKPVARAYGSDDDDPMRGRETVIDIGEHHQSELVDFYRQRFVAADGWLDGASEADVGGGHALCLVNNASEGYDEYLEIYPYGSEFTSAGPDRFLVSMSRLYVSENGGGRTADRCGLAGIWFPSDV